LRWLESEDIVEVEFVFNKLMLCFLFSID